MVMSFYRHLPNYGNMKKELSPKQREELLKALKARFEKNLRDNGKVTPFSQSRL